MFGGGICVGCMGGGPRKLGMESGAGPSIDLLAGSDIISGVGLCLGIDDLD